ncbi:MAG: hypothetical protein ACR2LN_08035 [Candidatus Levyibacteriota bacterium]
MRLAQQWVLVLLFVLIFVAFLLRGIAVPDPDFGWHIRAGSDILYNGIPYTDPFSYSMPSYPFVDHEWLTNVIWANTFNKLGLLPLLLLSTFFAVGSLLLQASIVEKKWVSILLFLAGGTLFEFVGVRTQLITWFFLSFLLCVLWQKKLWQRWKYFLPFLFFLWANLHGGFGIGIGVLGIVLVGRIWEEKKLVKERMVILGLCILATLINPFGIRLWGEFLMQLTDTQIRGTIAEWYPAIYFTNIAFWIYFSLSVFFIVRYRRHYTLTELFLYFFLLIEGLLSMRNIPLWIIASFALTMRGFSLLEKDAVKHKYGKKRLVTAYKGFFIIALIFFLPQVAFFFYGTYVLKINQHLYPRDAVIYIGQHVPEEQIFSSYDWGGYLDWQLPQKKVFIDGRMPSWRWQANKKGESNYAFDDYRKVLKGKITFGAFTDKYHISTLLVPVGDLTQPSMKLFGITFSKNSFLSKIFLSEFSFYGVIQQVRNMGWREVYCDKTAAIFEKPQTVHENNGS